MKVEKKLKITWRLTASSIMIPSKFPLCRSLPWLSSFIPIPAMVPVSYPLWSIRLADIPFSNRSNSCDVLLTKTKFIY